MPLEGIFPGTEEAPQITMTGNNPPATAPTSVSPEGGGTLIDLPKTELSNATWGDENGNIFGQLNSKRALPKKEVPFGMDYSFNQDKPLISDTVGPTRARLMQEAASGQPIKFDMMAGNYFKQMPLVTGKYTSEVPIAAMFAEEIEAPGPAAKELDAFNKRMNKVNFFPSVSGLGENIFKNDVTPMVDAAYARWGKRAPRILSGGGITKEERTFGNEFNSSLKAVENLANLTNQVGKVVTQIQKDKGLNKWVDPSTDKWVRDYLDGLTQIDRPDLSRQEMFDFINKGASGLETRMAFGRGLNEEMEGSPKASAMLKAQFGTAVEALQGQGQPFGGEEIVNYVNASNIPNEQVTGLVETMYQKGYRFGGTPDEDKKEIKRKILDYFIPSTQIAFLNTPYDKGISTQTKYDAVPREDVYKAVDKKTNQSVSISSPAVWTLTTPLKEEFTIQSYYNPETNVTETIPGPQKVSIQTIRIVPTHKSGPLKGQAINDVLLPTLKPEDVVNRIVAEGTIARTRKNKSQQVNQFGQLGAVTEQDEVVMEPAFFDYATFEPILKQRGINLIDVNKNWEGAGKSVKYTGPQTKKVGTKEAPVIREAATGAPAKTPKTSAPVKPTKSDPMGLGL